MGVSRRCTEWRPRHAAWRYGRHGGAAIGELIVSAMTLHVTAVLVLTVAVVGVGCEKRDPIVAEYSSVGSGRPDGGWTVRMYASGKCKVNGPIEFAGTYSSNSVGYQLQTVIPARSMPMLVYRVVHGIERGTTTLISVKTNGTEYLLEPTKYRSFQRTSDTNMLRNELKTVR